MSLTAAFNSLFVDWVDGIPLNLNYIQWNIMQPSKNEIVPFAVTCMELEGIILSEISRSEKDRYHMISLVCGIYETKQMNRGEGKKK